MTLTDTSAMPNGNGAHAQTNGFKSAPEADKDYKHPMEIEDVRARDPPFRNRRVSNLSINILAGLDRASRTGNDQLACLHSNLLYIEFIIIMTQFTRP